MNYHEFVAVEKQWDIPDTFFLKLKSNTDGFPFGKGQKISIKNPTFRNKNEVHVFIIHAINRRQKSIQLRIEITDVWTRYVSKIVKGDKLLLLPADL